MPQMSPLQWTSLFMFFSILFMITLMINYYLFSYLPKYKKFNQLKISTNWKW
uniref:ATP synthase complex subunit 8 n=1 Tax=Scolytinae sp. BMNH 1043001 TaxID=1903794 RepID=A0A343A583_9CUCU|nr:ATP synthase F0 subunit 8 [Scolytinae sp. BMNH 1043001]